MSDSTPNDPFHRKTTPAPRVRKVTPGVVAQSDLMPESKLNPLLTAVVAAGLSLLYKSVTKREVFRKMIEGVVLVGVSAVAVNEIDKKIK